MPFIFAVSLAALAVGAEPHFEKIDLFEGQTWLVNRSIEPESSGYSDLAVGPDGMIYCFYERGMPRDNDYTIKYLTLAKFNLAWVTQE